MSPKMISSDANEVYVPYMRPDELSWFDSIKRGIYDPHTKAFMGRTLGGWGGILTFYFVFLSALVALFAICMYVVLCTLSPDYPRYQLTDSLIGANPGLGFRPYSGDVEKHGSLIWYVASNESNVMQWTRVLDDFLQDYTESKQRENKVICDFERPPPAGKVCAVNVDDFGPCSKEKGYSYNQSAPCIFIKLNRIFNWVPEFYNETDNLPEEMDEDLKLHIKETIPAESNQCIRMAEKLHKYQGFYGQLHHLRDLAKRKYERWRDEHPEGVRGIAMNIIKTDPHSRGPPHLEEKSVDDYPHIYRRKTRSELVRISAAVMGIEFSYAAETAFVSPTLLKIGVQHQHMTMVWGLSPLLGFFVTPILGSLSDGCKLKMGRRRPFILFLSLGVLIGLILVPNGEDMGHALGDFYPSKDLNYSDLYESEYLTQRINGTSGDVSDAHYPHPWGVLFTVLGTVLLDFDADSCQSPARAYLLDVSVPADHARGLSTFTVMAGLGGFIGYALGGVNWDATFIGEYLGGHVRAVFTFITVLFIICVLCTVTSFEEIPLHVLQKEKDKHNKKLMGKRDLEGMRISNSDGATYGATKTSSGNSRNIAETQLNGKNYTESELVWPDAVKGLDEEAENPSLKEYLLSILFMPKSLSMVCLTNLFCWMSHVCYSLYFTDFVGEAVFNGDPSAPVHSEAYERYQEGVRFGCWGMSMYSLSCSCYSLIIEALIKRFRAKKVYIGGLLFYSVGMMLMALTKGKIGVILFSWTAGVMYSTLFTLPYLLVAHYHANGVFELTKDGEEKVETRLRGLGTDVAIVSSMVFLAQFILALCMGSIVSWAGTTTAIVSVASFLAFCGAISATKIMYLDL